MSEGSAKVVCCLLRQGGKEKVDRPSVRAGGQPVVCAQDLSSSAQSRRRGRTEAEVRLWLRGWMAIINHPHMPTHHDAGHDTGLAL